MKMEEESRQKEDGEAKVFKFEILTLVIGKCNSLFKQLLEFLDLHVMLVVKFLNVINRPSLFKMNSFIFVIVPKLYKLN